MLVNWARMGRAFSELNLLSLDDYVSFIDLYAGQQGDSPRMATQDDINAMLG